MNLTAQQGLGHDMERISHGREGIDCDLAALDRADFGVVDLIARLLLAACREDCQLRVVNAPDGLDELLALSGLDRLRRLRFEVVRQPEQREEPRGVKEEGDPADPIS
jgi:ABC-type transporter Mla MlaB component